LDGENFANARTLGKHYSFKRAAPIIADSIAGMLRSE